jgi:hypothetical protein
MNPLTFSTNPLTYAALGLALLSLAQLVLIVRLLRSARVAAKADERVTQLTAALAMLTDTTEEGFVNVATELERVGARPLPSGRKGRAIEDIAIAEALSESEVRLHLGLDDGSAAVGSAAAEAPEPEAAAPGVLDDLESWMNTLHKGRRVRGGRHAAVRA